LTDVDVVAQPAGSSVVSKENGSEQLPVHCREMLIDPEVVKVLEGRSDSHPSNRSSVLIVDFDEALLHSDVNGILAVIVANSITIAAAADQFTTTGGDTDLNVDAFRTAAVTGVTAGTGILHLNDLRLSTGRHFVEIFVLNIRIQRYGIRHDKRPVRRHGHVRNRMKVLSVHSTGDDQRTQSENSRKRFHGNSLQMFSRLASDNTPSKPTTDLMTW